MILPLLCQFNGVKVMSKWTKIKNTSLRLIFLHKESSISFMPNTMFCSINFKWIRSRLLMSNLHPTRGQNIDFWCVSKSILLHWFLSVRFVRINSNPSLILGHNLHHSSWWSIDLFVLHISIFRVIHHSEVSRHILLIS